MDAKVLLGVVLMVTGFITDVHGLRCYICERQKTYEGCTAHVTTCAEDQECFMDEVFNHTSIYYTAGCRSKGVCQSTGSPGAGKRTVTKRQGFEFLSCSRCCSSADFCNGNLCGISSGVHDAGLQKCYYCHNTQNQNDCNNIVTCDQDQVCGTHIDIITGGRFLYNYNCFPKQPCVSGSQFIVQNYRDSPALPPATVGKRSLASCVICCGDTLCNTGSCTQQAEKMHLLFRNHTFDRHTLKRIP